MAEEWKVSKKSKSGLRKKQETAVLVGIVRQSQTLEQIEEYLDELEFLALTAGAKTKKRYIQKMSGGPSSRTFIGQGKANEIEDFIKEHDIDMVIFDDDLTGKQTNILEEQFERKIIDRSSLILDIFANRAQTAQSKAQVEMAQLQYLLPRLRGLWTHLERQRGGIGMRGPGEQEIETDRRIVRDKISQLKKKLEKIDLQSTTQRKNRGELIRVSLVGYTNAGKSTLMNTLSKSDVFAENKLFATLDTTVRKVVFGNMPFLLSDTVGFIRKLPHHLIESFKSTLDEVRESDILLHVVDISHHQYEDHINTVLQTLIDLEAHDKPTILVLNKVDLFEKNQFDELLEEEIKTDLRAEMKEKLIHQYDSEVIMISALKKENMKEFKALVKEKIVAAYKKRYPYRTVQYY
ncbi:MAG: GTPase HflX [Saprospiraceae bacterium]